MYKTIKQKIYYCPKMQTLNQKFRIVCNVVLSPAKQDINHKRLILQ